MTHREVDARAIPRLPRIRAIARHRAVQYAISRRRILLTSRDARFTVHTYIERREFFPSPSRGRAMNRGSMIMHARARDLANREGPMPPGEPEHLNFYFAASFKCRSLLSATLRAVIVLYLYLSLSHVYGIRSP